MSDHQAVTDERDATEQLSDRIVEKLQDHLADVASGAVVATLWDEVRALREEVQALLPLAEELALLRGELAEGLVVEPSDSLSASLDAVRADVDELRGLLAQRAEPPAERVEVPADAGQLDALREELRALRRRIAVKASERVLDDAQLAQIADAVAERLGRS